MTLRITIGIATWNRCDLLAQTLDSLTRLRIPSDVTWEVLVCDNNSQDNTKAVVEAMLGKLPLRYLFESKQGKSHALNYIVNKAQGDWLMLTDDDVLVEPDWVEAYVVAIRKHPDAAFLFGSILPWLTEPVGKGSRFLLDNFPWVNGVKHIAEDGPSDGSAAKLPHGANMVLRRDALMQVGFDPTRGMFGGKRVGGEDTMLGLRMLGQGYQGWLVKDAKVNHYIQNDRLNLRWFWNWNKAAGHGRCEEDGPAKRGRFGYLWAWRIIGRRMMKAAWLWFIDRRRAYEMIGDAAQWRGYIVASAAKMRSLPIGHPSGE